MKLRYQFTCECGNVLNRNYVSHGTPLKCRKCGRTGEVTCFDGYNHSYFWHSEIQDERDKTEENIER